MSTTITTAEELDALPVGSVVLGRIHGRTSVEPLFILEGRALMATDECWARTTDGAIALQYPMEVLFRPDLLAKEPAEPTIRYVTRTDGEVELDEVIASNARVHIEKMNTAQWWIGLSVGDKAWHINLGAVNPRVKDYAHIENDA